MRAPRPEQATRRAPIELTTGIAPEGKRRWTPHWKSGFYHIARKASVPLVLLLVDYRERVIHVGRGSI
jgi:1-acyl-sn-glycerol-3-phosphate acyltransferase